MKALQIFEPPSRNEKPVESPRGDWERERAELIAEVNHLKELLAVSDEAAALALDRQVASAVELARADFEAAAAVALQRQLEEHRKELSAIEEGSEVSQRNAAAALDQLREEVTSERDRLSEELRVARELCSELAAERDHANQLLASAREEASTAREEVQAQLAAQEYTIRNQWHSERGDLTAELERVSGLLAESQTADERHAQRAAEDQCRLAELTAEHDKVRLELERLADTLAQKQLEHNRLQEECDQANKALTEARLVQPTCDSERMMTVIHEEEARVDAMMRAIYCELGDPDTDLTVVMRKNVELTQLESYLKGLRFMGEKLRS